MTRPMLLIACQPGPGGGWEPVMVLQADAAGPQDLIETIAAARGPAVHDITRLPAEWFRVDGGQPA